MKKGFTLVELIAVITILGIIVIIGVSGYSKVSKKVKIQSYENKIAYIEAQAAAYACEEGIYSTTIEELINNGYVEADNNEGNVINPIDKSILNDRIVTIIKEGEECYATVTEAKITEQEKDETNKNVEIKTYRLFATGEDERQRDIDGEEWTKENVVLKAKITNTSVDKSKIEKIRWSSSAGVETVDINGNFETKNKKEIKIKEILNTTYKVEIMFKDGTKYEATKSVKIDKQKPQMFSDETQIENENIWTNSEKKVTILGTDKDGSGIKGFYIGESERQEESKYYEANKSEETKIKEKYEIRLGKGYYYIWAVDKAGNISDKPIEKEVKYVDKEPPSCSVLVSGTDESGKEIDPYGYDEYGNKTGWFIAPILKLRADGEDEIDGSGIKSIEIGSDSDISDGWSLDGRTITLKDDISDFKVKAIIRDNAGNETKCGLKDEYGNDIVVKKDSTPPTCPNVEYVGEKGSGWENGSIGWLKKYSNANMNYQTNPAIALGICEDNGSGCVNNNKIEIGRQFFDGIGYYSETVYDNAGNKGVCSAEIKIDSTSPTCDISRDREPTQGVWYNKSDIETNGPVHLTLNCEDNGSGCISNNYGNTGNLGSYDYSRNDLENGKISGSVEDNAGNISLCEKDLNIDIDIPVCDISRDREPNQSGWYNKDDIETNGAVKVNIKCTDEGGSGCVNNNNQETYSSDINEKLSYIVKDVAGNESVACPIQIKIDVTDPSCGSWTGEMLDEPPKWRNGSLTVSVGCIDNGSGCVLGTGYVTYGNEQIEENEIDLSVAIKDNAGNTKICKRNNQSGGKFRLYFDNKPPILSPTASFKAFDMHAKGDEVSIDVEKHENGSYTYHTKCSAIKSDRAAIDQCLTSGCNGRSGVKDDKGNWILWPISLDYYWRAPVFWEATINASESENGSGLNGFYWGTNSELENQTFTGNAASQTVQRGFIKKNTYPAACARVDGNYLVDGFQNFIIGNDPYYVPFNDVKDNGGPYYYAVVDHAGNRSILKSDSMHFGYHQIVTEGSVNNAFQINNASQYNNIYITGGTNQDGHLYPLRVETVSNKGTWSMGSAVRGALNITNLRLCNKFKSNSNCEIKSDEIPKTIQIGFNTERPNVYSTYVLYNNDKLTNP